MTKSMVSWHFVQDVGRYVFDWICNPLCITLFIVRLGIVSVNLLDFASALGVLFVRRSG